ncbi:S-adenosyl-L-methionine-dependent methyltransferase [Dothidotthia symphoricarpi CBS 119687]|uniref:DNA (cytosine-5-)-methyltransferase n=1 Tax=Dothidotthia symphoricarpi CBS 119687 TaxID=1392245 RepID=A0A6A6AIZ1_9PLEO|nr:S-adenosyl-L-methionine-dependent methyltransferase [Dothidotthia symphoricarpi CBS 119687]KAF2131193.1 S-adenosyl-L-methionine-dependent methyltransferase [Dothidotthia symphoricarpi CBS 119687]
MSGNSLAEAISFLDINDDDDPANFSEDEVDVQAYDTEDLDEDGPITTGDEDDDFGFFDFIPPALVPDPTEIELPWHILESGVTVHPGTVIELRDHTDRKTKHMTSGDFLFVKHIIEDLASEEVILRGYRLRRCSSLRPLFDNKLNDLFMLIEMHNHDKRPRSIQGLNDVSPEDVVCLRRCTFTNLNYEAFGLRHSNPQGPQRLKTQDEVRQWIFHQGQLICRWVHVVELHKEDKSYGGEVRRMYKREVTEFMQHVHTPRPVVPSSSQRSTPTLSLSSSKPSSDDEDRIELTTSAQHIPQKSRVFTFGDGYCGAGGVSDGARQAGYRVLWGLENDPCAMAAYQKNFPGAMHLNWDAQDLPDKATRYQHGCDHLHMSCPCCFWSEAHTSAGANDEANILTLYTVEAWLHKLKSTRFSLEQAPGLLKLSKHRGYFRNLLNGILLRGYNVRYKIQDQAWFGIPQHRRRLIFVGSKIGFPLPPFPSPTHGPDGSGLKRFVTIEDALRPLHQQWRRFRHDTYHQPKLESFMDGTQVNPHISLAKCVTTSGGDNTHYSGSRSYTVREFSLLQGLSLGFHFEGSITSAKKQCGNVWPSATNKVYFLLWAAHHEAFDHGLIDAEDEVLDLYDFLEAKGVSLSHPAPTEFDLFDSSSPRSEAQHPDYRYLHRIEKTVKPLFPLSLWARAKDLAPIPQSRPRAEPDMGFGLSGNKSSSRSRSTSTSLRPIKRERTVSHKTEQEEVDFYEDLFQAQDTGNFYDFT